MNNLPAYQWKTWDNPNNGEPPCMDQIFNNQIRSWRRFIKPGDHCIDIGAWTGDTTLPMAILAGPAGRVISFECNPHILDTTRHNCAQKPPISPIVLVEAAADTRVDTAIFHYNGPDYCNGGLLLSKRDYKVGHISPLKVQLVPLRPFVTPLVKFIKIDTEGNEHRILESCKQELSTWHPTIQTEIYMDTTPRERLDFVAFLKDLWYTLYACDGRPISIKEIVDTEHLDIIASTASMVETLV